MAKLSKTEAARQLGISRTSLYKLIDKGKVSATPDGMIDQAELVRAAPHVDALHERAQTSMNTTAKDDMDTPTSHDEYRERPPESAHERTWIPVHEQGRTSTDSLVDILREQLQRALEQERAYEERERSYHEHIARLTAMLDQAHQQNQRLLDMPRSAPVPAPREPATPASAGDPRGDMRRRIVALLREHPEGLTPAELRSLLGVDKDLGDTCLGMRRDRLVQRVGPGRYVAATLQRPGKSRPSPLSITGGAPLTRAGAGTGVPVVLEQKTTILWKCLYLPTSLKDSSGLGGPYETKRSSEGENPDAAGEPTLNLIGGRTHEQSLG